MLRIYKLSTGDEVHRYNRSVVLQFLGKRKVLSTAASNLPAGTMTRALVTCTEAYRSLCLGVDILGGLPLAQVLMVL